MGDISENEFVQHFKKLNELGDSKIADFDPRLIDHSLNEFINEPFSENEILLQLKKLKNNKSAGIHSIINEFLKYSPF